jgi:hypothetical protein
MTQTVRVYHPFSSYFQSYKSSESNEEDFVLLYSRVGARAAGAASKFTPGAGAA